jgi:predicted RNA polymerase sigma factor
MCAIYPVKNSIRIKLPKSPAFWVILITQQSCNDEFRNNNNKVKIQRKNLAKENPLSESEIFQNP